MIPAKAWEIKWKTKNEKWKICYNSKGFKKFIYHKAHEDGTKNTKEKT
jgi:hypothetical protein